MDRWLRTINEHGKAVVGGGVIGFPIVVTERVKGAFGFEGTTVAGQVVRAGIKKPFISAELAIVFDTHGGRSYQSCKREDSESGALQCVLNSDPCDLREEQVGGYVEAEAYK